MARQPEASPAPAELIANVRKSVRTAVDVLTHLERSLERGGFAEGAATYNSMCNTLLGQRLWSRGFENPEIDAAFGELSRLAARIHATLAPYTQMMVRLGALSADDVDLGLTRAPEEAVDPDERRLLEVLHEAGKPISFTRLRTRTGLPRASLEKLLTHLVDAGVASEVRVSSRRMITLGSGSP